MDTSEPKTFTDLSLDQLKIMFGDRLSSRRIACVEGKYELLKYLWKESQIEDCYLEKYKVINRDEVSTHDDAFSRHLLESTNNKTYTRQNEYAKQRLADRMEPSMPQQQTSSIDRFTEKKFKIHDLIRSEIGNKWWDFGRYLDIRQGQLDTINTEQNEVGRKVDKVFEAFEQDDYSAVTYIDKVSSALSKSRRRDLARRVYQIIEH